MRISGPTYDFNLSNVNSAPDQPGVYVLYQDGNLIYTGSAAGPGVTLRSCLQAHKRGDLGRSTQRTTAFQTKVAENSVKAANRERNLLWDFQFINGRSARCNDPLLRYSWGPIT